LHSDRGTPEGLLAIGELPRLEVWTSPILSKDSRNQFEGPEMSNDLTIQDKSKLVATRNRELLAELRRHVAVMEALKSFISRRIATRKLETKVVGE
jgi:hypothetical protein